MRSFEYQTVDVFTDTRFGGNPLAVIPDARGLTGAEMQAIAREFNYSESTFVLPPADPANTAHVRIFTPSSELPFAGHPNVGTGFVLAAMGRAPDGVMRFEEGAGLVEVRLTGDGGTSIRAPQAFARGRELDPADIAASLTLELGDVITANHAPCVATVGLPFVFAELASLEALARLRADTSAFVVVTGKHPDLAEPYSPFVYARTGPRTLRARMLAPLMEIPEDPATGSACGAVGGLLASLDPQTDGALVYEIDQGVEMGRPSRIVVTATKVAGRVISVEIAGRSVPVMQGVLQV